MPPGVVHVSDEPNVERRAERQMGCMAGFLQMFDRSQFIGGRRVCSHKRLPSIAVGQSPAVLDLSSSSSLVVPPCGSLQEEKMVVDAGIQSPSFASENASAPVVVVCRERPRTSFDVRNIVGDSVLRDVSKSPETQPAATEVKPEEPKLFDWKDGLPSSWRLREAPRLSLDSRAVAVRATEGLFPPEIRTRPVRPDGLADESEDVERQRRSPSVVARLMGLDVLPDSYAASSDMDGFRRVELRRSASESRPCRELFPLGWSAEGEAQQRRQNQNGTERSEFVDRDVAAAPAKGRRRFQQSKGFESAEIFPDTRSSGNLYGEIERRLKLRGIDDPGKDLETLKQILEALQFKGLLHSVKSGTGHGQEHRNFIFEDRKPVVAEPPILAVKPLIGVRPSPPSPSRSVSRSTGTECSTKLKGANSRMPPPARRQMSMEPMPPSKPRKSRPTPAPAVEELALRNVRTPPTRSPIRGRDSERNSPRQTPSPPKAAMARRAALESGSARLPGYRKQIDREFFPAESPAKEYRTFAVSKNRRSTPCAIDSETQRSPTQQKKDDCGERRILLDRCEKEATEQPSPVSVLDAPFHNDDTTSPSPLTNRLIVFTGDHVFVNDDGSDLQPKESLLCSAFTEDEICDRESDDFRYVSDVVLASELLLHSAAAQAAGTGSAAVFSLLESRQKPCPGDPDHRRIHRRLVFDTVMEILQQKRQQPPGRAAAFGVGRRLLGQIWTEFRRIQRLVAAEDLCDVVSGAIQKDLVDAAAVDNWTAECPVGMADAVLDIERLIFKDLIVETIHQLALVAVRKPKKFRRQLSFGPNPTGSN